ncbi:hypothetical protein PBAL39_24675 [Pedobacter sp. BAL39]|nr:hypothetical protein PBAL39_24675 [Pedobacter sp. BAL39]
MQKCTFKSIPILIYDKKIKKPAKEPCWRLFMGKHEHPFIDMDAPVLSMRIIRMMIKHYRGFSFP